MTELVLPIVGMISGLFSVVYSLGRMLARERAERKLTKHLVHDQKWRTVVRTADELPAALEVERELILNALDELGERERNLVARGLMQPSSRGRLLYLEKLTAEAKAEEVRSTPAQPLGGAGG